MERYETHPLTFEKTFATTVEAGEIKIDKRRSKENYDYGNVPVSCAAISDLTEKQGENLRHVLTKRVAEKMEWEPEQVLSYLAVGGVVFIRVKDKVLSEGFFLISFIQKM